MKPVSALDVAAYILKHGGEMTAMKLQKLVYYAQAWSLVWDETPLFHEPIKAWANGPVVYELYDRHRGQFRVDQSSVTLGDPERLNRQQRETVDAVLGFYGQKSAQYLSDLTHAESPWRDARGDCPPGDRCDNEITLAFMNEYYSSLLPDNGEA
jgi:uncharacterized phage-associated protein